MEDKLIYEYRVIPVIGDTSTTLEKRLNELGKEGFHLKLVVAYGEETLILQRGKKIRL